MGFGDEQKKVVLPAMRLFRQAGWRVESWTAPGGHRIDFAVTSKQGRRVAVEGKNYRRDQANVDFWTVLGEIVVDIDGSDQDYGILVPSEGLPWFKRNLSEAARKLLRLRIFVMKEDKLYEVSSDYSLTEVR